MPNPFIPFGLKIRELTPVTVILDWDLDNTVEFKAGTCYNVYTSNDGLTYTLLGRANTKYLPISLRAAGFYAKVTSIVDGMGESAQSAPLHIDHVIGSSDAQDSSTIAITPTGDQMKLKTSPTGELLVAMAPSSSAGMATDAKLQDIEDRIVLFQNANHNDTVALNNDLNAAKTAQHNDMTALGTALGISNAALHTDLGALATALSTIDETLDNLLNSENLVKIITARTTVNDVTPSGIIITLPWKKKSIVHQITVLKKFGAATRWSIEVINKGFPIADENVILKDYSYQNFDPDRYDILKSVPYVNIENNDSIILRLTPDTGTSNIFYVALSGEEAR